ncbi:cytochrome P450 3A16 [Anabrus simplex]|uniref:cytochrome P450 3A16 n=1 Tax=Anabrus simplex TaxID=316456 RepID=UPI0035A2A733
MALETIGICVAAVALLLAVAYRFFTSSFDYFEKQGIPGPRPTLVFGNWWRLWQKFIGEEDLKNVKQYGKVFGVFNGRTPCLMTTDPELIKVILEKPENFKSHRASCVKCEHLKQSLLALEGSGSAISPEMNKALTQDKVKKLVPSILQNTASLTKNVEQASGAAEGKISVTNLVSEFLSNCLAVTLFGLDPSATDMQQFSSNLNCAFTNDNPDSPTSALSFIYPSWAPIDKFVLRQKANKYFTSLCLSSIEERLKVDKPNEGRLPDLVDLLLEAVKDEKKADKEEGNEEKLQSSPNTDVLVAQCLAVLLNASLTTKPLVCLSVSTLASKPEIQDKLHSELNKSLQTSAEISFELVQNSEYLDMFLGEMLRMYPIEFRLERECCEVTEWEKLKIEKGTIVSVPIYALHHLEEYYPEPDTFSPDRFTSENLQKRKVVSYLPFGQAGNNGANISVQVAMLIAKLALASLIKNFKFVPLEDTKIPPEFRKGITGVPIPEPITVTVQARK